MAGDDYLKAGRISSLGLKAVFPFMDELDMKASVLEVCVEDFEGAWVASQGGADRIELCEQLALGGVSPSEALLRRVRSQVEQPVVALIRCRGGCFQYDATEQSTMLEQAQRAIELGADGIAVGACRDDQSLDWMFLERMANLAGGHPTKTLVLHRVFDQVPNPLESVPRLVALGFHRILTSGGALHAVESLSQLAHLQAQFGQSIEILPAGGIRRENALGILKATGCWQLHGSFRNLHGTTAIQSPCRLEMKAVRQILMETVSFPPAPLDSKVE
jgi:copper homeostasis protein